MTDLNRALAIEVGWPIRCGWTVGGEPCELVEPHRHDNYAPEYPPDFMTSLDALRDGPERVLRESGWCIRVTEITGLFSVEWFAMNGNSYVAGGRTEAEARARAALAALNAMKEANDGQDARPSVPAEGGH